MYRDMENSKISIDKLNELLVYLICDPRKINCNDYPKNYFNGTMLQLVTKTGGYYWNIFNKQRIILIKKILKEGANPNQLNDENIPLIFCSLCPYNFKGLAITELLLKYGANPSVKYNNLTLVEKVNPSQNANLLQLLLKYDYLIVESKTNIDDYIIIENIKNDNKTNNKNENLLEKKSNCFNFYCCLFRKIK